MTALLKPCPFCGTVEDLSMDDSEVVLCYGCYCSGPEGVGDVTAREAWNARKAEKEE